MRYRELGNTGLKVSEIGFGTIPILSGNVPVLPEYFEPDLDEAVEIMMHAYRMGCNLYDTAIPEEYGDAEYKLGVFAEKVGRENIVISDKRTGGGRYEGRISPRRLYLRRSDTAALGAFFPDKVQQMSAMRLPAGA